jgi:hypothetical protein
MWVSVRGVQRARETMSIEILWSWFGMTATAVGVMAGVWWALADFILDRVGPSPAEWGSQNR